MQEAVKSTKEDRRSFFNNLNNVYSQLTTGQVIKTDEEIMLENIKNAHEEWENAENFFQNAVDDDLIDHAIFRLEAARTKYVYLMKQARSKGIHLNM